MYPAILVYFSTYSCTLVYPMPLHISYMVTWINSILTKSLINQKRLLIFGYLYITKIVLSLKHNIEGEWQQVFNYNLFFTCDHFSSWLVCYIYRQSLVKKQTRKLFDVLFILTTSLQHWNKTSLCLCLFTGIIRLQFIWSREQEPTIYLIHPSM